MRAQDSPFRPYWWATGLSDAGVAARADVSTYGRYSYDDLPPVPFAMNGDLDWLARQPEHDECPIVSDADERLPVLLGNCERDGLALPPAFTRFMGDVPLQRRIRSATSCYLDLDTGAVPLDGGLLVRFLADQQGCLYWYLHLVDGGADHAVVCSPEFIDSEASPIVEAPEALCFCAESFETFICRFWLENEIWFATDDGTPMPDVGAEYIERYREADPR